MDRLRELGGEDSSGNGDEKANKNKETDNHGDGDGNGDGQDTNEVNKQIAMYEPIRQGLSIIQQNTQKIKNFKEKEKKTAAETDRKQIMQQVNAVMAQTQQQGQLIKNMLKKIAEQNNTLKDPKTSAIYQMRTNLYQKNVKNFQDVMKDFNQASEDYRGTLQDRTRRELRNVGIKEDDIERVVESGNANEILSEAMLQGSENVDDMVLDIESRHSDILQLERQVLEVQELFLDLANLVSLQGEVIDSIETHIVTAKAHTENAADEMASAEDYQKKARKRQCCILAIVIGVLLVILGPVLGAVIPHS